MAEPVLRAAVAHVLAVVRQVVRGCNLARGPTLAEEPGPDRDCNLGRDRASGPVRMRGLEVAPRRCRLADRGLVLVRALDRGKELVRVRAWRLDQGPAPESVPDGLGFHSSPLDCPVWGKALLVRAYRTREPAFKIAPRIARSPFKIARPI